MAQGIGERNRRLLDLLHREASGPFTAEEASKVLSLEHRRTARFLRYLAERGWLSRIRRGVYTTVPLGATDPSAWREDAWVVAARLFAPCYIGGWSASEHWSLTEQVFRTVVVMTARPVRLSSVDVQDQPFRLKHISRRKLFGSSTEWRGRVRINVSDPSRTIVDILDDPAIGGGMRHGQVIGSTNAKGEHPHDRPLTPNDLWATVYKHLGIDQDATITDYNGRPQLLLPFGKPIRELI